jgi:transposase-like protein
MTAAKRRKKRGRPAGKPLSGRELEARRANLERARSAPKNFIYRPTARRLAARLKNLRKAQAARRSREGNARVRLNALKHGVYSRELLDESVKRLGESEIEFAGHRELFARLLVPQTEEEATIVWEISNLAWRRLRLFRAAADREHRDLRRLLLDYPPPAPLSAEETHERMFVLFAVLNDCDRVIQDAGGLRTDMREFFKMLIGLRVLGRKDEFAAALRQGGGEVASELGEMGEKMDSEG